jgi:hypothetical protein
MAAGIGGIAGRLIQPNVEWITMGKSAQAEVRGVELSDRFRIVFVKLLIKLWDADLSAHEKHVVLRAFMDNIFQTMADRDRAVSTRDPRIPRPRCSRKRKVRSN